MTDNFPMTDHPAPVAVTGVGVISPIGVGRQAFWSALCEGRSGIVSLAGADEVPRVAAPITDFSPGEWIRSAHLRRMDKLSRWVVAAAQMALDDAGVRMDVVPPERVGVVVGSGIGNIGESVQYLERLFTKGPTLASPMMFPNLVLNAPASYTAMDVGCTGANLTVSQGEISGETAVALGCELVRNGRAEVVLAGGADELDAIVISAYRAYRALSSQRGGVEWSSPYDVERNGVVLGEGAAMLVLESATEAHRRGATVYAVIEDHFAGAVPSPTYDWPAHAAAAVAPLRRFLNAAEALRTTSGAPVDLVCGGANSSRRLDACELEVLAGLFAETASSPTLTSIKGAIGEFAAAGALTAAAACLALYHGVVPPLCNLRQAPPTSPFQFAGRAGARRRLRGALVFSMARGGAMIALRLRRAEER